MDVILEKANLFVKYKFRHRITNHKKLLNEIKEETDSFDSILDKIKFVNVILQAANETYQGHKLTCNSPDCDQQFEHGNLTYFLTQELNRLGVKLDEEIFSQEEKATADSKLDQILKDLEYLKASQEVIYEDLTKEINELRELYFLGKKKWHQLLLGKVIEMTASGIVSETVSKGIIESFSKDWITIKDLIGV